MVDPISNTGGVSNISSINRTQAKNPQEKKADTVEQARPSDTVEISEEALNISQAEEVAKETRSILEEYIEETLSADKKRVDTLL